MSNWKNPNGTYNGVKMLSELSGISEAEVKFVFDRLKELKAEGYDKETAKAIVNREVKEKFTN